MKHLSYFDRAMKSPDRRYLRIFEKMGYSAEAEPEEAVTPKPKGKRKSEAEREEDE